LTTWLHKYLLHKMAPLEMRFIKMSNYILVEYSLMGRIRNILSILYESYRDNSSYKDNTFLMHLDDFRAAFSTKTNSDLYIKENRNLVHDIYDFLANRKEWEEDFVYNYNIFYDFNELTGGKLPLVEIDHVLEDIHYVVVKLAEIIRLDYEKMKKDNIPFSEDLAKYKANNPTQNHNLRKHI